MEQRVAQHTASMNAIAQTTERTSTLWDMIASEHSDRRKEIKDTVEEVRQAIEAEQAAKLKRWSSASFGTPINALLSTPSSVPNAPTLLAT
jgi:t-SNARE complex subunit (syntaxin)